jgi:hypothetical protein
VAEQKKPPTAAELRKLLPPDPRREAVNAHRGLDWQRWLTVARWLELGGEDALFIEWGEDFTTVGQGDARTIQAKDLAKPISLGQKPIRDLISIALARNDSVTTVIWTRAAAGYEKNRPFDEPGIKHWMRVVAGEASADALFNYLTQRDRLSKDARAAIHKAGLQGTPSLLKKVEWITDEGDIAELRGKVYPVVEERVRAIDASQSVRREDFAARLFLVSADVGLNSDRDQRRLTRDQLNKVLQDYALGRIASALGSVSRLFAGARESTPAAAADEDVAATVAALADLQLKEGEGNLEADVEPISPDVAASLERDLAARYRRAMRQMLFIDFAGIDLFAGIAETALSVSYAGISPTLKRRVLLRASRSAAVKGEVERAEDLLKRAARFPGEDSGLLARARIAQAKGETDTALQLVRDETSSDARSVFVSILSNAGREEEALAWLAGEAIEPAMLTDAGAHVLSYIYLKRSDFDGFLKVIDGFSAEQLDAGPQLLFLRGVGRFASVFPAADRHLIFHGIPAGARLTEPEKAGPELAERLSRAIDDFDRVLALRDELELKATARNAERNRRWCELLHPQRRTDARARLMAELADPSTAIRAVPFATGLGLEFDTEPVKAWLKRRERQGGLSDEDLAAAFTLVIHEDNPRSIADFIETYFDALTKQFDAATLRGARIHALIEAGAFAEARAMLAALPDGMLEDKRERLVAAIEMAEGADPAEALKKAFATDDSTETLRALIEALSRADDRLAVADYAKQLFGRTSDIRDLHVAARALASVGNEKAFLELVETHPDVEAGDNALVRHHATVLYRTGRLAEAGVKTATLAAQGAAERALDLEIAIAIEGGEWERLRDLTAAYLDDARDDDGVSIMRAAVTAQAAGVGPVLDLVDAALNKAPRDPHVLMGAYTIVAEEGLEEKRPQSASWMQQALELSDEEGPVKRFEIKQIIADQKDWLGHVGTINDAVVNAKLPLAIAARGLRTTLVDILLRNFARNTLLADPRRRASLPLFAGNRTGEAAPYAELAAFDLTALMTLAWVGLLEKALGFYPKVLLPAGAVTELFEGRQRIKRTQQSRLEDARYIRDALAARRLKVQPTTPSPLAGALDEDLAALIDAAVATGGVVVRPAPVHPPGDMDRELDMSAHSGVLTDMHGLLESLIDLGALTAEEETRSRSFFRVQDKGWPVRPPLSRSTPLYLDSLAVAYLHGAHLFEHVLRAFSDVYIDKAVEEEIFGLLENESYGAAVLGCIDRLRIAVRDAARADRVIFGAARTDEDARRVNSSTANLLSDLRGAGVMVVDDRALNREAFGQDGQGHRARVVTTLELLEAMREGGVITQSELNVARHKLRIAGAALMPVTDEEASAAVMRNRQSESAEFRAIRENLQLARMAGAAKFPPEIYWFAQTSIAIKNAIKVTWSAEKDKDRAGERAHALISLLPRPDDWRDCWIDTPPPGWIESNDIVMLASLALPVELSGEDRDSCNAWFEREFLVPMRLAEPARYSSVVDQMKRFMLNVGDDDDE